MSNFTALVPLDTTPLSESSLLLLPMLKALGFNKVRLLSVVDKRKRKDQTAASLQEYLDGHASRLAELGLEVETRVVEGDPAEACIAAAAEDDVDLVTVATHGRTGIARLRLGSVGEKIIKNSTCPRLVVGPNVEIDLTNYALRRILVPLDGSETSELSLPIAHHLAALVDADVDLIRSVSVTTTLGDPAMAGVDMITPLVDSATSYLERVAATFPAGRVTSTVVTGGAAECILQHLREHPVDLVVMVSRGRTGVGRMAMGSVAERVLQGPDPVLVFEPGEDRSRLFQAARSADAQTANSAGESELKPI